MPVASFWVGIYRMNRKTDTWVSVALRRVTIAKGQEALGTAAELVQSFEAILNHCLPFIGHSSEFEVIH
jgi:hypothetical protein